MDPNHGKSRDEFDSSQHAISQHDNNLLKLGGGPIMEEDQSCSSSTTSETSSEEDFFQLDASQLNKSIENHDEPRNNLASAIPIESVPSEAGFGFPNNHDVRNSNEDDGIAAGPMWSGKVAIGSSVSPSHLGGSSKSDTSMLGVKQSPPVQTMIRSDVPDPKRIPSSVFARTKSNAPMEWSVASNESLFSIHMGKSGDLTGLYNSQFDNYQSISPLVSPGQAQHVDMGSNFQSQGSTEATNADQAKDVSRIAQVQPEKEKPSIEGMPHSDSTSRLSDSSVNSYRSFAFPILTADGRNTSGKAESVHQQEKKEQVQQPPPVIEPPVIDPVAPQSKWFPCCSCCPSCC